MNNLSADKTAAAIDANLANTFLIATRDADLAAGESNHFWTSLSRGGLHVFIAATTSAAFGGDNTTLTIDVRDDDDEVSEEHGSITLDFVTEALAAGVTFTALQSFAAYGRL